MDSLGMLPAAQRCTSLSIQSVGTAGRYGRERRTGLRGSFPSNSPKRMPSVQHDGSLRYEFQTSGAGKTAAVKVSPCCHNMTIQ